MSTSCGVVQRCAGSGDRRVMARSKLQVAFEIGVILKGLNGLLELIGGILLLAFPPSAIQRFVVGLTHNELSRDPNDFIATQLRAAADHLSVGGKTFAAIFLLSHGVIKEIGRASCRERVS